jgi:exonuclease V gamma subunit
MLAQGEKMEFIFISKYIDGLQKISIDAISQQKALDTLTDYLNYYKTGHQQYFHFFPAIGRNEMEMISADYEAFYDAYEKEAEDERSYTFEDDYLNKAIEHGFFAEAAFEQIKENVEAIFKPIKVLLPQVFAKI